MSAADFDQFEREGWEERAPAYGEFFPRLTSRAIEPLLDTAGVREGVRVLDVACGPGQLAAAAAARGASVVGIDVSRTMLDRARSRYPGLDLRVADAHDPPFPDGSFDVVAGNFGILHFGRPEVATQRLVRLLAPGGRLALSTWDNPEQARFVGVFVDAMARVGAPPPADLPPGPPFFRFADPVEFAGLLSGAGLQEVAVDAVGFTCRFASADELWDGVLGATVRMRAIVLGQPAPILARVRAAYDELVEPYREPDGTLVMPVSVRVACGTRS